MLSYRATLDVPRSTARAISGWLAAHRKARDIRPAQRAATPWVQAVMLLRWLINATDLKTLARDAGVSLATAYRYLHEALEVISSKAPSLGEVIERMQRDGEPFVCLDGTLTAPTGSRPVIPVPATTCGTRASTRPSEAMFRSWLTVPATRCGPVRSSLDLRMTSPQPASTC